MVSRARAVPTRRYPSILRHFLDFLPPLEDPLHLIHIKLEGKEGQ